MSKNNPRFRRNNPALPAAVPNLFEVTVAGLIEAQQTINTFYYADGGVALVAGIENTIAAGWITAFGAAYRACLSSDWAMDWVKCQCLTSPSRMPGLVVVSGAFGTGPAGHEPTTVCITMRRISGVKGQAGRGRISLPAVPTAWVTESSLTTPFNAALTTFEADLGTAFVAGGNNYTAQVVSRKNKAGPPLGASPVLDTLIDEVLGTCRRRKLGRGK